MRYAIEQELKNVSEEFGVEILYACESGSRAWGFESLDSDYDVRFIYAHPTRWYLSAFAKRDVIEPPLKGVLDLSGWDLRKALGLLYSSNPPLLEWLHSPIVYQQDNYVYQELKSLIPVFYSRDKAVRHYYHMAKRNFNQYIQNRDMVSLKKYLYVLRPVLAARWIEKYETFAPLQIDILLEDAKLNGDLLNSIDALLARKRNGVELGVDRKIESLTSYLDAELKYLADVRFDDISGYTDSEEREIIDKAFNRILGV